MTCQYDWDLVVFTPLASTGRQYESVAGLGRLQSALQTPLLDWPVTTCHRRPGNPRNLGGSAPVSLGASPPGHLGGGRTGGLGRVHTLASTGRQYHSVVGWSFTSHTLASTGRQYGPRCWTWPFSHTRQYDPPLGAQHPRGT